jgi:hypothetical protein
MAKDMTVALNLIDAFMTDISQWLFLTGPGTTERFEGQRVVASAAEWVERFSAWS